MNLQYIKDPTGIPQYVILPVDEYRLLLEGKDEQWESIPYLADEHDSATIPHEIVTLMLDHDISIMAAWRIHCGLSQEEAATRAGLSQPALSQIERKGSKPQTKTRTLFAKIYGCRPEQLAV